MNGKEFVEFHKQTVTKMNDICKAKNQDYSGGGDVYAFSNFVESATNAGGTVEQGFLFRMSDKISRIRNLTQSGKQAVKDESVKDTLMDLANYSILMMGYIESKSREPSKTLGQSLGEIVGSIADNISEDLISTKCETDDELLRKEIKPEVVIEIMEEYKGSCSRSSYLAENPNKGEFNIVLHKFEHIVEGSKHILEECNKIRFLHLPKEDELEWASSLIEHGTITFGTQNNEREIGWVRSYNFMSDRNRAFISNN